MIKFGARKSGFTSKLKTETGNDFSTEEHALYRNPQERVEERAAQARASHDSELKSRDPIAVFVNSWYSTGSSPDRLYCNQSAKGEFIAYKRLFGLAQSDDRIGPELKKLAPKLEEEAERAIQRREALMQLGIAMYHRQLGEVEKANEHYGEFRKWLEGNRKEVLVELQDKSVNLDASYREFDPSLKEYGEQALRGFQKLVGERAPEAAPSFDEMKDTFGALRRVTYFLEESMIAEVARAQPGFVREAISRKG